MKAPYSWNSLSDLFECLNSKANYVILRNFESIEEDCISLEHPDIDILCDDRKSLIELSRSVSRTKNRRDKIHREIWVNGKGIDVDIRCVGDGYYDPAWGQEILNSRHLYRNSFFVPNPENYFYTLLYHALIQKRQISPDYRERLEAMAENMDLKIESAVSVDTLQAYMKEKGYFFTYPENLNTRTNFSDVDKALIKGRYRGTVRIVKKKLQSVVNHLFQRWEKK